MITFFDLFDINTIFFTTLGYPMSYIEFFGTICGVLGVYLATKGKVLSWPIGLVASALYFILFYQIQLYADLLEQVYYIITGFVGWYLWIVYRKKAANVVGEGITKNTPKENVMYLAIIAGGTVILSFVTMRLHLWFPSAFPEAVSLPVLDAGTTVVSFVAQWLLMRKKIETWYLWIGVDIIAVGLYWYKGVKFVSLEYALFLVLATLGFLHWRAMMKK